MALTPNSSRYEDNMLSCTPFIRLNFVFSADRARGIDIMAVTVRRIQQYEPHIAIFPCHTLFETAVIPGQFTAVIGPYCRYAGLVVAFDLQMTLPLRAEATLRRGSVYLR